MSIFMKATLKVDAFKLGEFLEVLEENLVPMMEDQGWRLHGCFRWQRFIPDSVIINEVAILWEVANLDRFLELLDVPETAEAMAQDGVKRDTVKVYVLDKEFKL